MTYLVAGVTNEIDAASVDVLNVTTTGPGACFDGKVCLVVECEGAETCRHDATHKRSEESDVVCTGTSKFIEAEALMGIVIASDIPKAFKAGTVVGACAEEGETVVIDLACSACDGTAAPNGKTVLTCYHKDEIKSSKSGLEGGTGSENP